MFFYLLIFFAAIAASLFIGYAAGRQGRDHGSLSGSEKKELRERRDWMGNVTNMAHHHNLLGDNFALIVIDEANKFRNKELG